MQAVDAIANVGHVIGILWHHLQIPGVRQASPELADHDGKLLTRTALAVASFVEVPTEASQSNQPCSS